MTHASDARQTEDVLDARQKAEAARKAEVAKLRMDFDETFGSEAGKRVLRFIMDKCGYQVSSIVADPKTGDIYEKPTIYNEARRNLYVYSIRSFLRREILMAVEHEHVTETDIFS